MSNPWGPRERQGSQEVSTQLQLRRVLELMVVLWGDLPVQCSPGGCGDPLPKKLVNFLISSRPTHTADKEMYENQQARKQRLYKWLKNTNAPATEKEVVSAPDVVSLRRIKQY